jgi:hypothetical protein
MEANLQARLTQAAKRLQALVGECCTINQITYPCIVGQENLTQELTEGGWKDAVTVTLTITLPDILASPVAPVYGNTVLLVDRARTYRLEKINPTQTTWELTLVSVND